MLDRWKLVTDIDLFATKPELTTNTSAFDKEVHAADHIERVAQNRKVLIDFRIKIRQAVAAAVIEMAMHAFNIRQPVSVFILSGDARQNDIARFVLVEFMVAFAKPLLEQPNDTGSGTFGNVSVDDRFGWIVWSHCF